MGTVASTPTEPLPKAIVKPIDVKYEASVKNFVEQRHRVVIVSINYPKTSCPLKGCINDGIAMRDFLVRRVGNKPLELIFLRDNVDPSSRLYPTHENIMRALKWAYSSASAADFEAAPRSSQNFKAGNEPGTVVTFYYSGHGSYQKDRNGDETDGWDETLCPVTPSGNFDEMIVDDELRSVVGPLITPNNYSLFLTDCCHSGTVFDLGYSFNGNRFIKRGKYVDAPSPVIHLGACYDHQTAQEGNVDGVRRGYFTHSLITALKGNARYDIRTLYNIICNSMVKYVTAREEMPQLAAGSALSAQTRVPI